MNPECPTCGKELKIIPNTESKGYGYCRHCEKWVKP